MKKLYIILLILTPFIANGQVRDDLDNRIHGLTTIVTRDFMGTKEQGSGFYWLQMDSVKGKPGEFIKEAWLVTNRHLFFGKDKNHELLPSSITFNLRSMRGDSIKWYPITVSNEFIIKNARVHKDPNIDLVILPVFKLIKNALKSDPKRIEFVYGISDDFVDPNSLLGNPQVTDDVVIIGYPEDFYDKKNAFPLVKKGIIASRYGANFNGEPCFLVDAKIFNGSSGSLVISRPTNFNILNGDMGYSKAKQYIFLGIVSGEPWQISNQAVDAGDLLIQVKEKYDVAIVWYGFLIPEIVKNGVAWISK